MKTLADFKQEVAINYGFESFKDFIKHCQLINEFDFISYDGILEEAAELYSDYRVKEAKQEFYDMGWNAAINNCIEIASTSEDRRLMNDLKNSKP